ncbi:hypothetical protein [Zavarzinia sp.]|uniref:hypothetical protein n=1 Tax=Zavarzinia sp. TaxID=2027920 RepID=UPI003568DEC7
MIDSARRIDSAERDGTEDLRQEIDDLRRLLHEQSARADLAHRAELHQVADAAAGCKHCGQPAECPAWRAAQGKIGRMT